MSEPRRRGPAGPPKNPGPRTATRTPTRRQPEKPAFKPLPPFKVLLHNDPVNEMGYVVRAIMELVHLSHPLAMQRMMEAHQSGLSLLTVTHKERAELYIEQFASKKLTVTIEAA